ncbi:flagellar protein FlaG, partial [Leclercia adecarboxylata]|uniref:flagellar protein FlaG n=1 Tax=Leclercia adecarboxylata TaxID=83655 RepID=UPI00234DFEE8
RSQVQNLQRDLSFSVDDSTGDVIVQVVDGESGKVVRQIPSEEILRLAERIDEMRSLLFETKA